MSLNSQVSTREYGDWSETGICCGQLTDASYGLVVHCNISRQPVADVLLENEGEPLIKRAPLVDQTRFTGASSIECVVPKFGLRSSQ